MATKKKGAIAKSPSPKKTASRKKTAKKTASKKHAARKVSHLKTTASPVEARTRRKMIAEVAYFRSLQRHFEGGSEEEDWLIAETQVDQKLARRKN